VIADNKLAINAGWDEDILAEELKGLLAADLEFDIGLTGFSISEIDNLIEGLNPQEPGAPEDDLVPQEVSPRCRPGDLWKLGSHRPICGDGAVTIPIARAVMRSVAVNAAKGSQRSQRLFTELLANTERENRRSQAEWLEAAISYKIHWEDELARRERLGITGPNPLPHPDHVIIDFETNTAHIRGPATKEQKREWDKWVEHVKLVKTELQDLENRLEDPTCMEKDLIQREIKARRIVLGLSEGNSGSAVYTRPTTETAFVLRPPCIR
jgi:hypothetical protein